MSAESLMERLRECVNGPADDWLDLLPEEAAFLLAAAEALERLVAALETNSEEGAPEWAHAALAPLFEQHSEEPAE